jgi:hypothetical protein
MSKNIVEIVNRVAKDKGVAVTPILRELEGAMTKALTDCLGDEKNPHVQINYITGEVTAFINDKEIDIETLKGIL